MSNDTENNQLNGCFWTAVLIVVAVCAAGFLVVKFIWERA